MVKRLKRRMKRYITQTPELERYYEEYRQEVATFDVVSYPEELVQRVAEADIVYVGDFHTLLPAQKFVIRLIDMVQREPSMKGRPLVVCLEAFHSSKQEHVDHWLAGKCTFFEFLELANYRRNWGFPVKGYQRIADLCHDRSIPILGINSTSRSDEPLRSRDRHAAKVISRAREEHPDALFLVFIGDLHIAEGHLPQDVADVWPGDEVPNSVIVYTNPETIYWSLTDDNLEYIVNVVKISEDRFAVINATPLAKYESYLRFVEGVVDDRDWDPVEEPGTEPFDIEEQTVDYAIRIAAYLGIERFEVPEFELATWDSEEETVGEMSRRYGADHKQVSAIIAALQSRQPAFIGPYGMYLHDFSLNDAADLAARLVLRALGWEKPFDRTRNAYYGDIIYEAFVYFATKIINPKRTCKRESDLADWTSRERMKRFPGKLARQLADVVGTQVAPHLELLHRALGADDPGLFRASRRWWQSPLPNRFQASRLLGARLGERLFYSVQIGLPKKQVQEGNRRRLTIGQITRLLFDPASLCADARGCYLKLWFDMADVVEHHQDRAEWF
jgi:hypothetical protein